jgi:mRNA interferase HigB
LDQAQRSYPNAKAAFQRWRTIAENAQWKHLIDVRKHFSADAAGKCTVFDVKGNEFRLIAIVDYVRGIVIVKYVLTHADYSKDRWKNECGCD